jgi:hypothetical protein
MELTLQRIAKRKDYTIGKMYIEGTYLCDTLEPTWRDYQHGARKIAGRSAIPEGRYAVVVTWSIGFKRWLPQLIGNWKFNHNWQGVRIHAGNNAKDTRGCILVGENRKVGMVLNSRACLKSLMESIQEAKDRGEPVWLTVM